MSIVSENREGLNNRVLLREISMKIEEDEISNRDTYDALVQTRKSVCFRMGIWVYLKLKSYVPPDPSANVFAVMTDTCGRAFYDNLPKLLASHTPLYSKINA